MRACVGACVRAREHAHESVLPMAIFNGRRKSCVSSVRRTGPAMGEDLVSCSTARVRVFLAVLC